jgi:ABC-type nitrate/sulfonate/bicarbonate transport system ATPase subunit
MAQTKDVDMVLVMGLSGAGKSYFINALTGAQTGSEDEAKVGKKLKSCKKRKATTICPLADSLPGTTKCQAVATAIGNTDFVIVSSKRSWLSLTVWLMTGERWIVPVLMILSEAILKSSRK